MGTMLGRASLNRMRLRLSPLARAVVTYGRLIASSSDTRATRLSNEPGTTPMAIAGRIHDSGPRYPKVGRTLSTTPNT